MREREVPEPLVVEPWWQRFGSTALTLLRQIAQRPLDPLPRLILADFLEENGAPERAEFIRLQVAEMNRRWGWEDKKKWTRRERELWRQHQAEWLAGLPGYTWAVWGGLVEGVIAKNAGEWRNARQHLDLRRVACDSRHSRDPDMVVRGLEWLAGVVALKAERMQLTDAEVAALAQSPHLHNLTLLDLRWNRIADVGVQALAQSPYLQNLTTLILWANEITDAGVAALARSPHLQTLTFLNLRWNRISAAGAEALRNSPYLRQCEVVL